MEEKIQTNTTNPISPPPVPSNTPLIKHSPKAFIIAGILLVLCLIGIAGYQYVNHEKNINQKIVPPINNITPTSVPNDKRANTDTTANWKTYTDQAGMYSLNYPSDVRSWNDERCQSYDPEKDDISSILFTPTFITDCYTGRGSEMDYQKKFLLRISVEPNASHLDTKGIVRKISQEYLDEINKFQGYGNTRTIEEVIRNQRHLSIGGDDAMTYPSTCDNCNGEYWVMSHGDKIYNIKIVGDDGGIHPDTLERVHQILSTFNFIDNELAVDTGNWEDYSGVDFTFKHPKEWNVQNIDQNQLGEMVKVTTGNPSDPFFIEIMQIQTPGSTLEPKLRKPGEDIKTYAKRVIEGSSNIFQEQSIIVNGKDVYISTSLGNGPAKYVNTYLFTIDNQGYYVSFWTNDPTKNSDVFREVVGTFQYH